MSTAMPSTTQAPVTVWEPHTYPGNLAHLRGLVVIEQLSTAWGYHRAAPWADLGTHVWADFALTADNAPHDPRPYVFAD